MSPRAPETGDANAMPRASAPAMTIAEILGRLEYFIVWTPNSRVVAEPVLEIAGDCWTNFMEISDLFDLDIVVAQQIEESGPADPEQLGRPGDVSFNARQRPGNFAALRFFPRLGEIKHFWNCFRLGEI